MFRIHKAKIYENKEIRKVYIPRRQKEDWKPNKIGPWHSCSTYEHEILAQLDLITDMVTTF